MFPIAKVFAQHIHSMIIMLLYFYFQILFGGREGGGLIRNVKLLTEGFVEKGDFTELLMY